MAQKPIWPGSSSFSVGDTPYGFYDTEAEFTSSADQFADWTARTLGYPIIDIELQSGSFYSAFEESVTEYASHINQYNIKENLLSLKGAPTGSSNSLTHKRVNPSFSETIFLSEQYGTEAGVGGRVDYKKGRIDVVSGSQEYDLNKVCAEKSESGNAIEVRRVYFQESPAQSRFYAPYAGSGIGAIKLLSGFGWGPDSGGGSMPGSEYLLMPVYADMLRLQAIEFNDLVRKSAFSFTLTNNKVRLFPIPVNETTQSLYFDYLVRGDRDSVTSTVFSGSQDVVSDFSNAPYYNMKYNSINDVGKQWIRKYGLAVAKETLGLVRSKYGSIPIPGAEVTMDGDTLRSEGIAEKEALVSQLKEMLEASSRKTLLEADKDEAEYLQEKLAKVPLKIYVG